MSAGWNRVLRRARIGFYSCSRLAATTTSAPRPNWQAPFAIGEAQLNARNGRARSQVLRRDGPRAVEFVSPQQRFLIAANPN
jgi:hypothetical protein